MPRRLLRFGAFCTFLDLTMAPQNPGKLFAARGKTLYLEPRRACQPFPRASVALGLSKGNPPSLGNGQTALPSDPLFSAGLFQT